MPSQTLQLYDRLTGALIGLARSVEGNEHLVTPETDRLVIEGLSLPNNNFNDDTIQNLIEAVQREKRRLVPGCFACASSCGRTDDYDMRDLWEAKEDIRSLKSLLLSGIRGIAAYAYHAAALGYTDAEVNRFFYKALVFTGMEASRETLLPVVLEAGEISLKCMALLNRANTTE